MVCLLVLLVSGCSYPVDDLTPTKDKLIVQCEFEPGNDILMYVFEGKGIPTDYEIPRVPDSVEIQIMKGNADLEVFRRIGTIPYYESRAFISPGDQFILKAKVPSGSIEEVYAETYVPYPSASKDLLKKLVNLTEPSGIYRSLVAIEFGFEDINEERFFEIDVYLDEIALGETGGKLDWEVLDTPVKLKYQGIELQPGLEWLDSRNSFLVDFKKLDLDRRVKLELPLNYGKQVLGARVHLVIKSHSADGYRFIYTYNQTRYKYATVNPVLISNIENGIGCFIACSRTIEKLEIINE